MIADGARNGGGCTIGEHRTAHICLANSSGNVVEVLRMQHRAASSVHGVTRSGRRPGVLCRRFADYLGRTGRDGSA
ncbi:hypothetical protein [Xanthomonas axonopodis]|uniref:hypothetical protein n=1 Tax=Xanthomonas axonopodis TaxID=53413 RepID=UPI001115E789|nr:hypothetical protein [Xanthomonas axonopodis]